MSRLETHTQDVIVHADDRKLPGLLSVPERPIGLVVFAHGSGSSRNSPRNQQVAGELAGRGCATLLFDLLTDAESRDRANVFDIELLGRRMIDATRWATEQDELSARTIGYFGASTGAAAALAAAAELRDEVTCVVSRGGRPDLAGQALPMVTAPTLLIVGSRDAHVLDLNRLAAQHMTCTTEIAIIDDATHLFEEPGALEQVSAKAGDWFERWLLRAE